MILNEPEFNQRDLQLATLGRKLFFDVRFSANQQVSCATCHQPGRSFSDGLKRGRGISEVNRNTPTIINSFANYWFFWDGRADSLAAQVIGPLENPHEHGLTRTEILDYILKFHKQEFEALFGKIPAELEEVAQIRASPKTARAKLPQKILATALPSLTNPKVMNRIQESAKSLSKSPLAHLAEILEDPDTGSMPEHLAYQALDSMTKHSLNQLVANVGLSIESYERGVIANQSPFDNFIRTWSKSDAASFARVLGEAFGEEELAGWIIFQTKGNCRLCHTGPNFSDNQFHNIALPPLEESIDIGRALGLQKVLSDDFNCKSKFLADAIRQNSESCKDLAYLDPESPETIGSFKTPTLRNLKDTAPYMHDGRFADLASVLRHYNMMSSLPSIGFKEEVIKPLGLDQTELELLERFLNSLNSPIRDLTAEKSLP